MRLVKILKHHDDGAVCAKCKCQGVDVVLGKGNSKALVCARCYLPFTMPNLETLCGMLAANMAEKGLFGAVSEVSRMIENMKR